MSTEVKPIIVIYYLPDALTPPNGMILNISQVNEIIKPIFPDYHTLAIPSCMSMDGSCEDVRLEVFHPKDFTPIQFQELEKMVKEAIENIKIKPDPKDY